MRAKLVVCSVFALVAAAPLRAQQDGLIAFPDVYRVQFENAWVRLVRVLLPAGANLAPHTHPPGIMLHIYFNDADPVMFNHDGAPYNVTRPAVHARSYRVGQATPETHAVFNLGGPSDYMRVELKTLGDESARRRVAAPPLANQTDSVVEVTNAQYRATRVTVAAGGRVDVVATATHPALIIALTEGAGADSAGTVRVLKVGQERFVHAGGRETIRNAGTTPIQLLRIDLLTQPGPF